MIGKFYESFGKEQEEIQELPKEVIDILNSILPENFMYMLDSSGHYRAVPKTTKGSEGIRFKIQVDFDEEKDADIIEKIQKIAPDNFDEYFYRTQRRIPIKNAKIGDEQKLIPIEVLTQDPLSDDEVTFTNGFLEPHALPDPIKMLFESPEGDQITIGMQQQAYDSLDEIKFLNVDFPALKIELYQYSPLAEEHEENAHTSEKNQLVVTYSVTPSNATSVKDAVAALHIFRGLYNGTTKVNGHSISPKGINKKDNPERVEDALAFWKTALMLEQKLNVFFDPRADCPEEDIRFLVELKTCLLDGKVIVWRHPFDHFHIGGVHPAEKGASFRDVIGKKSIRYKFLEGPLPATLLGAKFDIYSHTEMRDFVITNIEWDDCTRDSGEVYISDELDKQWVLTRLYITEAEMNEFIKRLEEETKTE